jgi:hypothetical protein
MKKKTRKPSTAPAQAVTAAPVAPLSREALMKRLRAAEIRTIDVPMLGEIRVQMPSFARIVEIRAGHQGEDEFRFALAAAACVDLTAEDWTELRAGNNGLMMSALISAIYAADSPITDAIVGK